MTRIPTQNNPGAPPCTVRWPAGMIGPVPFVAAKKPPAALLFALAVFAASVRAQGPVPPPKQWGTHVSGAKSHFAAHGREIALTFDVCRGAELDDAMIAVLEREQVPATLFIGGPWLRANPDRAVALAANPLFEIENHGADHRPLSTNGRSAYGIPGTRNAEEAANEIECNARALEALTGRRPALFRPGTGHCDEAAVKIADDLGYTVVTFDTIGDEGATLAGHAMAAAILRAHPGSIVVLHLHKPRPGSAEGLAEAVTTLRKNGFGFVKLGERPLLP